MRFLLLAALIAGAAALPSQDDAWMEITDPAPKEGLYLELPPLDIPLKLATENDEFLEDGRPSAVDGWKLLDFDQEKFAALQQHVADFDKVTLVSFEGHHLELETVQYMKPGTRIKFLAADGTETEHEPQEMISLYGKVKGDDQSAVSLTFSHRGSFGFVETQTKKLWLEKHPRKHAVLMDLSTEAHQQLSRGMLDRIRAGWRYDEDPKKVVDMTKLTGGRAAAFQPQKKQTIQDIHLPEVWEERSGRHLLGSSPTVKPTPKPAPPTPAPAATRRRRNSVPPTPPAPTPPAPTPPAPQPASGNDPSILYVAVECDGACYSRITEQGYADVETYFRAITASTSAIYKRDFGRSLQISHMKIHQTQNPYGSHPSDLGGLLNVFGQQMNRNSGACYDMAHLFTGSGSGGLAALGTACNSGDNNGGVSTIFGTWECQNGPCTGISSTNWDLIVSLHEMGHNVGSPHTHSYNPPIDNCVACAPGIMEAKGTCGGSDAQPVPKGDSRCVMGTIMSYCHLCGGDQNINMKFSSREQATIEPVLRKNCGPLPGETVAPCADQSSSCGYWLQSNGAEFCGWTLSNPVQGPANEICCKTCQAAAPRETCKASGPQDVANTPARSSCRDQSSSQCPQWAAQGMCNKGYTIPSANDMPMKDFCAKSCGGPGC